MRKISIFAAGRYKARPAFTIPVLTMLRRPEMRFSAFDHAACLRAQFPQQPGWAEVQDNAGIKGLLGQFHQNRVAESPPLGRLQRWAALLGPSYFKMRFRAVRRDLPCDTDLAFHVGQRTVFAGIRR